MNHCNHFIANKFMRSLLHGILREEKAFHHKRIICNRWRNIDGQTSTSCMVYPYAEAKKWKSTGVTTYPLFGSTGLGTNIDIRTEDQLPSKMVPHWQTAGG